MTELFNISLVFTTQSYFPVPKNIRLGSTRYSVMKFPHKGELQHLQQPQLHLIIYQILTLEFL